MLNYLVDLVDYLVYVVPENVGVDRTDPLEGGEGHYRYHPQPHPPCPLLMRQGRVLRLPRVNDPGLLGILSFPWLSRLL